MNVWKIRGRVLLIDPDPSILFLMASILDDIVENIHKAQSGQEALEKLRSNEYDVLISETNLPDLDGVSILEDLAKEKILIPSILVIRYVDKEKILRAMRAGTIDFIQKPFDETTIKQATQNAISFKESFSAGKNL
ncbi:MAG: response regulator [Proteobacteria bacterium]|nr:MAG: response regulator [Pseudomonadota bacterium]